MVSHGVRSLDDGDTGERLERRVVLLQGLRAGVAEQRVGGAVVADERDQPRDLPFLRLRSEVGGDRALPVDGDLRRLPLLQPFLAEELLRGLLRGHLAGRRELHDGVLLGADPGHGLGRILRLPALGKGELELEVGMEEPRALEVALPGILAVDQAVDHAQVLVAVHLGLAEVHLQILETLFGGLLPVPGIRVRLQPFGKLAATGELGDALERLEDVHHLARVVPVVRHVREAELVRLVLVVAAELEEQHLQPGARDLAERRDLRAQHRANAEADGRQLGLADLVRGVARGDVPALVPHHTRELRFGHQRAEDASRDVDRTAGQRERVHRRVLDHVELPGQVLAVRVLRERLPHLADVRRELRVLVQAYALLDVLRGLLAHVDLLRFGDEVQLQVAGRGVAHAGGERGACHRGAEDAEHGTSSGRRCRHRRAAVERAERAAVRLPDTAPCCSRNPTRPRQREFT